MSERDGNEDPTYAVARRWCAAKGTGWSLVGQLGKGGTATVFEVVSPQGARTLKVYDAEYSSGQVGEIEADRIAQQVALGVHGCPYLVKTYEGATFEDRHYLLMSRAPGQELEKCLAAVPRSAIRLIVDQIARACIFLREKNLCHRDIKSANIFVTDDFAHATLLDLSVTRGIQDKAGMGTDHDGQLPVVATARYSPPEYLFRLLAPGPELWNALDIYQLGALQHDLIMRRPLFQDEYAASKANRYRFAWIVATTEPIVAASDVDHDLIFTARRALDKNWQRRSTLTLNDFLLDTASRQTRALETLGLLRRGPELNRPPPPSGASLARITSVANSLQFGMRDYLREQGMTVRHSVAPGDTDRSKTVQLADLGQGGPFEEITYSITVTLVETADGYVFETRATLAGKLAGSRRERSLDLPPVRDGDTAEALLGEQAKNAIAVLAALLVEEAGG